MPRPKKVGGPEPKKRSRNGCWPCKGRKVKCGEEKPQCLNCERQGEQCDYSIRLNWEGRSKKKDDDAPPKPTDLMDAFRSFPIESGPSAPLISPKTPAIPTIEAQDAGLAVQHKDIDHTHGNNRSSYDRNQGISENKRHLTPSNMPVRFRSASPNVVRANSAEYRSSPTPSTTGAMRMIDPALRPPSRHLQDHDIQDLRSIETSPITGQYNDSDMFRDSRGHDRTHQPLGYLTSSATPEGQDYPSPSDSAHESPNMGDYRSSIDSRISPRSVPPAVATLMPAHPTSQDSNLTVQRGRERTVSPDPRSKRVKLSPVTEYFNAHSIVSPPQNEPLPSFNTFSPGLSRESRSTPHYLNRGLTSPPTPATSSVVSDDGQYRVPSRNVGITSAPSPELRRLSVSSLLSGPPGAEEDFQSEYFQNRHNSARSNLLTRTMSHDDTITYGLDRGFPDLDMANDDTNAINAVTPSVMDSDGETMVQNHFGDDFFVAPEFGFGLQAKETAFAKGGYYAQPVPVKIPRSLEPLPHPLLANPMNLLYFHHFLNHTARILVPHDCSENPFKSVLPRMAVEDINLLNLLLAYSASHRARLLGQPEPANRIALWVQHVFPTLRHALEGSNEQISNANLATAIMLASLEIISPNTFGVEVQVPWQNHLNTARRMIIARGGPETVHRRDKVSYFLSRWFAYLDVLGSLSGGKNDQPLFIGSYWANDDLDEENDYQIDCLLGFTSRCVSILAKIAELARQCDGERIDPSGTIRPEWRPSSEVVQAAGKLQRDLQEARTHVFKGCNHNHPSQAEAENEKGWDSIEMIATNDAFHWAGLVHLHRRVLGKPSSDPQVQTAVREIVGLLCKVRKGGTAEACLLFPMFTAGCDARDQGQRDKIMDRIKSVEQFGMTQVHKARSLMQKVWATGKPWETLVTGEFVG